MTTLLYAIAGLVMLGWLVLLVDCIRRRQFWPLFASSRLTKVFWLLTFLAVNPMLMAMYWLFGRSAGAKTSPSKEARTVVVCLVMAVLVGGFMLPIPVLRHIWMGLPEPSNSNFGMTSDFYSATIEAKNNTNSSCMSTISGERCPLAARSIMVWNTSDHPLMEQLAELVGEQLRQLKFIQSVQVVQDIQLLPQGQLAPDIVITLKLPEAQESGLTDLRLQLRVDATLGSKLTQSNSGYLDGYGLSVYNFLWKGQVHHTSVTHGKERRKYAMAAENIAKDLAKTWKTTLSKWQADNGLLPQLPREFYPRYEPPPELPALNGFSPRLAASFSGLLKTNHTFWYFSSARPPVELFEDLQAKLSGSGWKIHSEIPEDEKQKERWTPHLRGFGGNGSRIEIYPRTYFDDGYCTSSASKEHEYVCELMLGPPDEQYKAAMETILTPTSSLDVLFMCLHGVRDDSQRKRLYELIDACQAKDASACIILAEWYVQKDKDKARQRLRQAKVLSLAEGHLAKNDSRIKELTKKLGEESFAAVTADDLRDAGCLELNPDMAEISLTVGLDEPCRVFFREANDKIMVASLKVSLAADADASGDPTSKTPPYMLTHDCRSVDGGGCSSKKGLESFSDSFWPWNRLSIVNDTGQYEVRIRRLPPAERFEIQLRAKPPKPKAGSARQPHAPDFRPQAPGTTTAETMNNRLRASLRATQKGNSSGDSDG